MIIKQILFHPVVLVVLFAATLCGCQPVSPPLPAQDPIADLLDDKTSLPVKQTTVLEKIGFTTQVGAFSRMDNAVRLEQKLKSNGIDAYHFLHESGFYKVRFGDHQTYADARNEAERLQEQGVINGFLSSFLILAAPGRRQMSSDICGQN